MSVLTLGSVVDVKGFPDSFVTYLLNANACVSEFGTRAMGHSIFGVAMKFGISRTTISRVYREYRECGKTLPMTSLLPEEYHARRRQTTTDEIH
ncbi:hypothetical protein TNCV_2414031 [Trichonephila clavipes]|nr:hypothetical protein TNCV_2414031 [Trichonephila clavipes]